MNTSHRQHADLALLHPATLTALALLLANDHLLRRHEPQLVAGKLSDLAGAYLLPICVVSCFSLWRAARHRSPPSLRSVRSVCLATAALLCLVKMCPAASLLYGDIIGAPRAPVLGAMHRVHVVTDATDVVAVIAIVIAWLFLERVWRRLASERRGYSRECLMNSAP